MQPHNRRFLAGLWLAALPVFLAPAVPAAPQQNVFEQYQAWCQGGASVAHERRVIGCTALIQALKSNSRHRAIAHFLRGAAYYDHGDYDQAIADFDEAIRINPKYAEAFDSRASAWRGKGDLDRALADYDEAVKLSPEDADMLNNRGNAYNEKGDPDRAIADFDRALKIDPKSAGA
jgi:tetratricopeptide (TPR) repeat protein